MAPASSTSGVGALWDPDGRRVPGGALAPDPPASGDEDLSFSDILSIINPLQHIPVVSSIYRWITGDTISPAARVIGGALLGGPIGLVSAAMNAMVEQVKGSDIGEQVLAMVMGEPAPSGSAPAEAQLAAQQPDKADAPKAPQAAAATPAVPMLVEFPAKAAPSANSRPVETAQAAPAAVPTVTRATQGRPLAFYQANAGIRLAPVERAPDHQTAAAAMPAMAATKAGASTSESDTPGPPDTPPRTWFAATMLQGLDRYRAMQKAERARPQVDLSQ